MEWLLEGAKLLGAPIALCVGVLWAGAREWWVFGVHYREVTQALRADLIREREECAREVAQMRAERDRLQNQVDRLVGVADVAVRRQQAPAPSRGASATP